MARKLWLVEWLEWDGYDVYTSFVGCFETEAEARACHPHQGDFSYDNWTDDAWISLGDIAKLRVTALGVAFTETPTGVIHTSFRHG